MLVNDEHGERTEQPTPLRLAEARRRGQVGRSAELTSAAVVLSAGAALWLVGGRLLDGMTRLTAGLLDGQASAVGALPAAPWAAAVSIAWPVAAVMAAAVAAACLANLAQVGAILTVDPVRPEIGRILPTRGVGRLFSFRTAARGAAAAGKLVLAAGVVYVVVGPVWREAAALAQGDVQELAAGTARLACGAVLRFAAAAALLAAMDYLYQRWQHRRDLRITRRQLRDDLRQMEGDGRLRARRAQLRQHATAGWPAEGLADAAVITSPRGLAVIVRASGPAGAPRTVAKASGAFGRRIARRARATGGVVVEDASLASRLFRQCRVGQKAPDRLRERVNEVLEYAREVRTAQPRAAEPQRDVNSAEGG